MKHLKWESNGRTFQFTDELDQVVPGKFVYKSRVGQKNVEQNGEYFPYLWDKEKKILKFGTCEIRLTDTQVEYWQENTKLLATSVHPEIEEASIWNRKDATVSGLRLTEHLTERAVDKVTLAYDITTADQKGTFEITVGGHNKVRMVFANKNELTQTSTQRLTVVYDRKGELVQTYSRKGEPLPIRRYSFGKSHWFWRLIEQDDHAVEQLTSATELHLLEKDYTATEIRRLAPDSWGPTETSDDCDDYDGNYEDYYDEGSCYDVYTGNVWGDSYCIGWIFSNIPIPAGATAENGCKIDVYVCYAEGSGATANLQMCNVDAPAAWGPANLPSSQPVHATSVAWNGVSTTGAKTSPEIKALWQHRFDDEDWESGDDAAVLWKDNGSGNDDCTAPAAEEDTHGHDGAEATIVYSTGGPSESPSVSPSVSPSLSPSVSPSVSPSLSPSVSPSLSPSASPSISASPSVSPSISPSLSPSVSPSASPSLSPSLSPSISPSVSPSVSPSYSPELPSPSVSPSLSPSLSPSVSPSISPSISPSLSPSVSPSASPSVSPSLSPSISPSASPSVSPSISPSVSPSLSPSVSPSLSPSVSPSASPSPSATPSVSPSVSPSLSPSISPSVSPSVTPSLSPSLSPSVSPSVSPSASPSFSVSPSVSPSASPSFSVSPSVSPSASPSPSATPSVSPPAEGRTFFEYDGTNLNVIVQGTLVAKFKANGDIDVNRNVNQNAF